MDGTVAQPPIIGAGVVSAQSDRTIYTQPTNPNDARHAPRKPSGLQISVNANDSAHSSMRSPRSPKTFEAHGDPQDQSPRSSKSNNTSNLSPKSPRERLDEFLRLEDSGDTRIEEPSKLRNTSASPTKAQSYSQLRNISSPLPDARSLGNSSPPSPRSTTSPLLNGSPLRPGQGPRTSSIDSAISSISLATTHSPKGSLDSNTTASSDISGLIKAAGSPEGLIYRLLREKQQLEGRNAQLWNLVEKQRNMVLGLNKDLQRAAKGVERYREELNEYKIRALQIPSATSEPLVAKPRRAPSPAPSDSSADLPIQGQGNGISRSGPVPEAFDTPQPLQTGNKRLIISSTEVPSVPPTGPEDWVGNTGKPTGTNHSHKHTSSSDLGVFNLPRPSQTVTPLEPNNIGQADNTPPISPTTRSRMSPPTSFTAKRTQQSSNKPFNSPSLILTESTPIGNDLERMTPPRKAPPAPLDFAQPRKDSITNIGKSADEESASEYDDDEGENIVPMLERGRKKTREEDDVDREILQKQQEEERSQSKKKKSSKSRSKSEKMKAPDQDTAIKSQSTTLPTSMRAFAPEPTPALDSSFTSQPASLAGVLSPGAGQRIAEITQQTATMKAPLSPGLPISPRPSDRPVNAPMPRLPRDLANSAASPPMSPGQGFVGLPLSPRAARQQIPLPPQTPMSIAPSSPRPAPTDSYADPARVNRRPLSPMTVQTAPSKVSIDSDSSGSVGQVSNASKPRGVFRGFMTEAYPNLLLPPNALPSIKVMVVSSRLKPSRQSLVLRGADEEPVFTLGVSARYDEQDLWSVEKPITSLLHLDQQIRHTSRLDFRLPDRSLFSGHAPAKVDARRMALEKYFETLLDTQLEEKAAVALCQYLSTNVSQSDTKESKHHNGPVSPIVSDYTVPVAKEGYLTKRGKNFGGWKARYFVLDEPVLRYHEAPGSAVLGTIKLYRAQIGKQSPPKASGSGDEGDSQYRHAFLIREPKKRTPILSLIMSSARPKLEKGDSGSSKQVLQMKSRERQISITKESPETEEFDSLQSVPYEETKTAQPPQVRITPDVLHEESPSPTTPGSGSLPSEKSTSAASKQISGPQNGAKISDAGKWGNKPKASPLPTQKEHKKRSLFGFHNKESGPVGTYHPNGSDLNLTQSQQQYQEQITNVKAAFGAPLAEAAEFCAPKGVRDVCLPAVVYRCLEYLTAKDAANEEGLFRLSGSNILIKNLKAKFNAEGDFDILGTGQWYDLNAIASLLKQYLRELPSMILTRELHIKFLKVLEIPDEKQKINAYNAYVHQLPKPNFTLLRALCDYLVTVISKSDLNKMDTRNVCIVFSPTLNIPMPLMISFLSNFDAIFGDTVHNGPIPALDHQTPHSLSAEDIRSPRRQMFSDLPTPAYNQTSFSANQQPSRQEPNINGLHGQQDLGFAPLQPSYNHPPPPSQSPPHEPHSLAIPAIATPRRLSPGASAKQSRRESSMLLLGPGQRKSSLPMMRSEGGQFTTLEH
ncbi:uncharacterized protein KY384_009148 [Bacidia gigantensis]|uniref:uncharacterized protein n=1 Tax=Bacidia gigantensis TaxID=2732470 RepID=UPI001D04633F|nr:uncharacterized protein KY384_009148 [Bacidia gigantensis]KAG8525504.1 hypothetical protein KY384_009148 [Bacidia gigantensis]